MVQLFQIPQSTKGRFAEETGRAIGSGIGDVLQEATQYKRQRGRLQQALKSIENISPEDRKNPFKLTSAVISATAGIPGAERYVGPLLDTLMKSQGITASQNVAPPGYGGAGGGPSMGPAAIAAGAGGQRIPQQQPSKTPGPEQGVRGTPKENALYPTPKPATAEVVRPRRSTELAPPQQLMTPQEMMAEAQRTAQQKTAQGVPTRWEDEMPAVEAENTRRQAYNQQIQADNKNILSYRNDVENGARAAYKSHIGDQEGSEKDAQRFVKWALEAEDATSPERFDYARRKFDQLQAARAAVRQQPSRPDWLKNIARKIEGSDRSLDQAIGELNGIVKPLIDMGEFQEARDLLTNDVGLGLDEVERVIHPMNKEQISSIDAIPEGKTTKLSVGQYLLKKGKLAGVGAQEYIPQEKNIETLKNEIPKLLEKYPELDLIQVRNKLSKRNYDWREFSQAIQTLDNEGKLNKLNQDSRNNIQYLYNPPVKGFINIFKNFLFGKE